MASSPAHHFGAPYYGAHHGHRAYEERRQPSASGFGPDMPYYYTDVLPVYFLSSSAPVTGPRDVRPNTGRVRRHRPSTTHNQRMHDIPMLQGAPRTRHTTPHRRSPRQVWFVPEPPAWGSHTVENQATTSAIEKSVNHLPQPPLIDGKHRVVNPDWTQLASAPRSQSGGSSGAALDRGLPSPPPTPRISRLRTPDIMPVDCSKEFCGCCPRIDQQLDSRWKMELQCKSRCRLDPCISLVTRI